MMRSAHAILLLMTLTGWAGPALAQEAVATFAGGCFWCMEEPFDRLDGVTATISGYIGGHKADPTYEEVSSGTTGHTEAVQVHYDPAVISYDKLLDTFWRNIDPTTVNRQFSDQGTQYRTGIFYHNDEQRQLAEASKKALEDSGRYKNRPIVTEITAAGTFYPAEEYHQDYYLKSGLRYNTYKKLSGREGYLKKMWGNETGQKKLQICPDEWIENHMPSRDDSDMKRQYFIIDEKRRETSEFDLDWIKANCDVRPQKVF